MSKWVFPSLSTCVSQPQPPPWCLHWHCGSAVLLPACQRPLPSDLVARLALCVPIHFIVARLALWCCVALCVVAVTHADLVCVVHSGSWILCCFLFLCFLCIVSRFDDQVTSERKNCADTHFHETSHPISS